MNIKLSRDVILDRGTYPVAATALLGIKGVGKTYLAQLIAERFCVVKLPWIAVDAIGVWRWLRVPGAGKGYPIVVAGGEGADIPLTVATAPAIVEAAMAANINLVLDLFDVHMSKADWRRIVKDVFTLMLHKNKEPRHIFLEEAAEFVPQQLGRSDVDGATYGAVEKLVRMGGNRRLGITLINQRAEEVNKAVLELCDNLFLFRQKGKNSINSLDKWLTAAVSTNTAEVMKSIPLLGAGECWAWLQGSDTPKFLKVPKKTSFHPNRNEAHKPSKRRAVPVDKFVKTLNAMLPKLEEAAKAADIPALNREIARLKAENTKLRAVPVETKLPNKAALKALLRAQVLPQIQREVNASLQHVLKHVEDSSRETVNNLTKLVRGVVKTDVTTIVVKAPSQKEFPNNISRKHGPALPPLKGVKAASMRPAVETTQGLSGTQQRIIDTIAWYAQIGITVPKKIQVAAAIGKKVKGDFANQIGGLRTRGYVSYAADDGVALTTVGADAAHPTPIEGTLIDAIMPLCSTLQRNMLTSLKAEGRMLKESLAEEMRKPVKGDFANQLGNLRTLGFVVYPDKDEVDLADWLK